MSVTVRTVLDSGWHYGSTTLTLGLTSRRRATVLVILCRPFSIVVSVISVSVTIVSASVTAPRLRNVQVVNVDLRPLYVVALESTVTRYRLRR